MTCTEPQEEHLLGTLTVAVYKRADGTIRTERSTVLPPDFAQVQHKHTEETIQRLNLMREKATTMIADFFNAMHDKSAPAVDPPVIMVPKKTRIKLASVADLAAIKARGAR